MSRYRAVAAPCVLAALVGLALASSPGVARAQSTPAQPAAPTAEETGKAGDGRLTWESSLGANFAWQSGVTDQHDVQLTGSHIGHEGIHRSLALEGSYLYSKLTFQGHERVVADSQILRGTYKHQLRERVYLVGRASFTRNEVQLIDYLAEELVGIGFGVGETLGGDIPIWRFDIIPIVGAIQQQKHIEALDGAAFTVGLIQSFMRQQIKRWQFTENFAYLHNTTEGDDYRFTFDATLSAKLFGPISGQITYHVQHQNIVAVTAESTDQRIALGFSLKRP